MESEQTGDYIALVVRLQESTHSGWYVHIDGTHTIDPIPLKPATLILRLWRVADSGLLRGSIHLQGSDHWAPLQSNAQLEVLMRAWLMPGRQAASGPP